ncbi:tRNA lysidine(34) synthetase TilS [Algicella marina]|uniref:tRNA(Ile)-lysidine synthase n=1 Tax=Algicella marina TaxID=2683284 RepID=A0A6P1T6U9_9RHOB|nr:tRNA lysidine(34) synthetase TilS [Algicella marina]QHQ37216.1 tRNA lysidine(34) synthetase TilS [Algicella marina]
MAGHVGPEAALAAGLRNAPAGRLGVAVSGGSDSVALMHLLAASGREIAVATVDHGLRAEAAEEAKGVAAAARALGLTCDILEWRGWDGAGNVQDAARAARRRLLGAWAAAQGLAGVALGHTLDDQAETFLMRLARGSGVDGLAAMQTVSRGEHVPWLRPLLKARRSDLRDWLTAQGIGWVEDPSNDDQRFDRVRLRKAMPLLEDLGLWPERLAATADRMAMARTALEALAAEAAGDVLRPDPLGYMTIQPEALATLAEETRLRLLAAALNWVGGTIYRPRIAALREFLQGLREPGFAGRTLHGVVAEPLGETVILVREPDKAGGPVIAGKVWDGRWRTNGPDGTEVRALGADGLAQLGDWRALGHPRTALLTVPGIFRDAELIAAPFAKEAKECDCVLVLGPAAFFQRLAGR